jgi:Protein of unknown function (DUF3078)
MKKILLTVSLLLSVTLSFAQDAEKENLKNNEAAANRKMDDIPDGWKKAGTFSFLFNQSAFNNEWSRGGTSNIAGNFGLDYEINYKMGNVVWDNKLVAKYGATKLKDAQNTTKTADLLDLNSLWGKRASGNWYYSAFANLNTQMDSGFDKDGNQVNHFFSPAFFKIGPGMLWKKSDNLKVNIAPLTSRFTFVHGEFTKDLPDGITYYGVKSNKTNRFEFGASVSAFYKVTLMENITMENNLNLYSNYLDKPQNVDIDYRMDLIMKINKYMSTNLSIQTIYDDNTITKVQVSELFGVGINYGF